MEQPVFRFPSHTQAIVSISFGEQGGGGGGSGGLVEQGPWSQSQGQLVLISVKKMGKIATGKVYDKLVMVGYLGVVQGPPFVLFFKEFLGK